MRLRFLLSAATALSLTIGLPMAALAHTELLASTPADGAQLDEPPVEVVLTFEGEIGEASAFTVTDVEGAEVGNGELDLDVADRNVLRGDVTIAEEGAYTVTYSIVGEDGDPIEGELTFAVGDVAPEPTTPNTATVPPGIDPSLLGLALVVMAGLFALRANRARG